MPTHIACLKITLNEVEPPVMRRIEVPLSLRLDRLHLTLQAVMGWENYHLYEFVIEGARFGIPDPEWNDDRLGNAAGTSLEEAIEGSVMRFEDNNVTPFSYLYDFGDNWEHAVSIERISPAADNQLYPRLLDATSACPPEDCGGSWGYAELLMAMADPDHERHEEMVEWLGVDQFNPLSVDTTVINAKLETLARKWAPKTRLKSVSA